MALSRRSMMKSGLLIRRVVRTLMRWCRPGNDPSGTLAGCVSVLWLRSGGTALRAEPPANFRHASSVQKTRWRRPGTGQPETWDGVLQNQRNCGAIHGCAGRTSPRREALRGGDGWGLFSFFSAQDAAGDRGWGAPESVGSDLDGWTDRVAGFQCRRCRGCAGERLVPRADARG
jgi:hypothetical protein